MSATLVAREPSAVEAAYLAEYEAVVGASSAAPDFLAGMRRRAMDGFIAIGFPTTDQEEWRFTNVGAIAKAVLPRSKKPGTVTAEQIAPHIFETGSRLVFVDGYFAPEHSSLSGLPAGVVVDTMAHLLANDPARLEGHLGRYANFERHPFVALNTALFSDGAYVELPRGAVIPEPLLILHVASGAEPASFFPRNLIVAGENSQSIIVESFVGLEDQVTFTCAVSETVLAPGAVVDHSKLQKESTRAFHMATMQYHQARASNLYSHSISTGGALVRNDVNAVLAGEGADCTLNGLYVLDGAQFLDNHMRVDHVAPHCNSYELFKGILDGKSRAVFNGRIFVAKGAQKTDAKQSSRNLLLSKEALVNANPQLEIFADDVKCTHGSTVGQLDDEAIFYLRSRGIGAAAARSILTYAFASDVVERIKVPSVRHELTEFLFHRLPAGEVVRQAV